MVDIDLAIKIFGDSIDKDFHLDNRTTYAREPISNILRGKNIENPQKTQPPVNLFI